MKIDKAIQNFVESYNEDMISYIDNLSNDRSLILTESKISLVDIKDSFDKFNNYLEGYKSYLKDTPSEKIPSKNSIYESVKTFINEELMKETNILYENVDEYVKSYIEEINTTINHVDELKSQMMSDNINLEYVGNVNDFVDMFIEKMEEKFNESMDKLNTASGYKTRQMLNGNYEKKEKEKIIFV